MDKNVHGICYVCGEKLEFNDECHITENLYEKTIVKEMRCQNCGAYHTYWISKDDEGCVDSLDINDQGFGNCEECGGILVWSADFMRSDFIGYDEPLDEDDDSIVRNLSCSKCGCQIEVIEPSENEIKSGIYPYWEKVNENS